MTNGECEMINRDGDVMNGGSEMMMFKGSEIMNMDCEVVHRGSEVRVWW